MNTQRNLKEPYLKANIPLLDEDFDVRALEFIDLTLFRRESSNTDGYIMSFNTQTR